MSLSDSQRKQYEYEFKAIDSDNSGFIESSELASVLKKLKMYRDDNQVKKLLAEADTSKDGKVDLEEFLKIMGKADAQFTQVNAEYQKLIQVKGASGHHSFSQEEMTAFAIHLNNCLSDDKDLAHLIPVDESGTELCKKVRDGLLLCKFINKAVADTIDERALNKRKGNKDLSLFEINENQQLCISAAKSIGVKTVNIGAGELIDGDKHPHLVLGMVWQLVKIQLLNSINLKNHPELIRLLEDGETLQDLLALPPEQLLLRWFNYHLKNAGHDKRVTNFSGDVKDSTAYTVLLHQIAPQTCDKKALSEDNQVERAKMVIQNASRLDVKTFIAPTDITKGNARLNLAFTAAIFNQCPGLDPLSQEELEKAGLMDDDFGDSREERAFRMWINSLGVEDLYVNNLFEDLKDGIVLLKVMDKIENKSVDWKKVETKNLNKFKRVSNCNYAVDLAKAKPFKFSLVGIGGVDIVDGKKKLVLALVWQLMRHHTIKFLAETNQTIFKGKEVTDDMIIKWANDRVKSNGKSTTMSSFKDSSLADSLFFIDLLSSIEKRIIDWDLVTKGQSEEDRLLNAKYAISIARKLGATIFLLPEDITEVKPKMILTFVASLMAVSATYKAQQ